MEKLLELRGVAENLPLAVAAVLVGWVAVKAIIVAWERLLAKMASIVNGAITTHEKEKHTADDVARRSLFASLEEMKSDLGAARKELTERMERGWSEVRKDIRAVHERIDSHMDGKAKSKRNPDDSYP